MLEGAKSIGVGAATIALAGDAVGIGNGMPTKNQLISFANECNSIAFSFSFLFLISFFFLSYFFPMTTRNGQIKNFILNSSSFFIFYIKISFFVIVYKSYHFSCSSLLSFFTPPSATRLPSRFGVLLFYNNSPAGGSKPTGSSSFRRAKLLSELL